MSLGAEERRKLIYELLIEAKGIKEQRAKVEKELDQMKKAAQTTRDVLKGVFGGFAVATVVLDIGRAVGAAQQMREQFAAIGLTGDAAAQAMRDVQATAFTTGQTMSDVAKVYAQAVGAVQSFGGTQRDAARLADSFTRAMVVQGKGAAEAAAQLDTMGFAMSRGSITAKELQGLLKDNPMLLQASQEALKMTTAELLRMAEAGNLGAQELKRILAHFEDIADEQEVGFTLERIAESFKTLVSSMVDAAAKASGLNDALKNNKKDGEGFIATATDATSALYGFGRAGLNALQIVGDVAGGIAHLKDVGGIPMFLESWNRDTREAAEGWKAFATGVGLVVEKNADLTVTAGLLERIRQHVEAVARLPQLMKDINAGLFKEAEAAARMRAQFAETGEKARASLQQMAATLPKQVTDAVEKGIAEIKRIEKAAEEAREQEDKRAQDFHEQMMERRRAREEEALARVQEFTDVVGGELASVFTMQTENARMFFASIARGFAQILASRAAQRVADMLSKLFTAPTQFLPITGSFDPNIRHAAHGAVISQGQFLKFAQGGVVTQPTVFPMAGGAGLMGESGAEAVMPLKRMSNGNLGVASALPAITIVNQTGVNANARIARSNDRMQIVLEAAQLGAQLAEGRMTRSIRTGYGTTASVMQSTYALRRGGGS